MSFVEVIVSWQVVVFSENVIVAAELPGEPVGAATAPTASITARTAGRKSFLMAPFRIPRRNPRLTPEHRTLRRLLAPRRTMVKPAASALALGAQHPKRRGSAACVRWSEGLQSLAKTVPEKCHQGMHRTRFPGIGGTHDPLAQAESHWASG